MRKRRSRERVSDSGIIIDSSIGIKNHTGTNNDTKNDEDGVKDVVVRKIHNLAYYVLLFVSLCCLIKGLVLARTILNTSEECDMTWSRRQFIEINLTSATRSNLTSSSRSSTSSIDNKNTTTEYQFSSTMYSYYPYRLYKFFDTRDPRHHWAIVSKERDLQSDWIRVPIRTDNRWCTRTTTATKVPSYQPNNNNNNSNHTASTKRAETAASVVVLYVPGHYGSYQQARSIGAHGIQFIRPSSLMNQNEHRILQKLKSLVETNNNKERKQNQHVREKNNNKNGFLSEENDDDDNDNDDLFLFDVFALDFQEEGGAFHGSILQRQANYIEYVIHELISNCQYYDSVIIVAHSMGGISSIVAYQQTILRTNHGTMNRNKNMEDTINDDNDDHHDNVPQMRKNKYSNRNPISAIITLASPHSYPVLSWSPSMYNLYNKIQWHWQMIRILCNHYNNSERKNDVDDDDIIPIIITISGGLRDEMIPPTAPYYYINHNSNPYALTIHSTDLLWHNQHEENEKRINTVVDDTNKKNTNTTQLGMDHRSIVWCKHVLQNVRNILFVVHMYNKQKKQRTMNEMIPLVVVGNDNDNKNNNNNQTMSPATRSHKYSDNVRNTTMRSLIERTIIMDRILNTTMIKTKARIATPTNNNTTTWNNLGTRFYQSVTDSRKKLCEKYGYYKAILMEIGFLYNLDVLVLMYTWIGFLHYYFEYSNDVYYYNTLLSFVPGKLSGGGGGSSSGRYNGSLFIWIANKICTLGEILSSTTTGSSKIFIPMILSIMHYQWQTINRTVTTVMSNDNNHMSNDDDDDDEPSFMNYQQYNQRQIPFHTLIVLAYVADLLFLGIRSSTNWFLRGRFIQSKSSFLLVPVPTTVVTKSTTTKTKLLANHTIWSTSFQHVRMWFVLYVVLVLFWIVYAADKKEEQKNIMTTWFFHPESVCLIGMILIMYSLAFHLILVLPKEGTSSSPTTGTTRTDTTTVDCNNSSNHHQKKKNTTHHQQQHQLSFQLLWCNQQINYIIWAMPTLIILLFGDMIAILKGLLLLLLLVSPQQETTMNHLEVTLLTAVSRAKYWYCYLYTFSPTIVCCVPIICIKLILSHHYCNYVRNKINAVDHNNKDNDHTTTKDDYFNVDNEHRFDSNNKRKNRVCYVLTFWFLRFFLFMYMLIYNYNESMNMFYYNNNNNPPLHHEDSDLVRTLLQPSSLSSSSSSFATTKPWDHYYYYYHHQATISSPSPALPPPIIITFHPITKAVCAVTIVDMIGIILLLYRYLPPH